MNKYLLIHFILQILGELYYYIYQSQIDDIIILFFLVTMQYTQTYGGDGGDYFNDYYKQLNMHLTKVNIRSGSRIDSIQIMLSNQNHSHWLDKHGGNGGTQYTWQVPNGQYITQIQIRHGSNVDSLTFTTNKGIKSPKYGGDGGKLSMIRIPQGHRIIGITGRSGSRVDKLGFVLAHQE